MSLHNAQVYPQTRTRTRAGIRKRIDRRSKRVRARAGGGGVFRRDMLGCEGAGVRSMCEQVSQSGSWWVTLDHIFVNKYLRRLPCTYTAPAHQLVCTLTPSRTHNSA